MSTGYKIKDQEGVYYLTLQVVFWADIFIRQIYRNIVVDSFKRNNKYQLWTHENHPENIYSNKFIAQKITYIHDNPVRAGLVEKPEEYVYSSAKAYAGESCVLDITVLMLPWITY